MNAKKKKDRIYIQNLICVILLICGIALSFVFFYRSNVTRISHQNENYIADIATQRTSLIGDMFKENIAYIESSALVLETAFQNYGVDTSKLNVKSDEDIDPSEVDKVGQILRDCENRFAFNYLRFIDLRGRDYTTGDKIIAANVAERAYFKEGISGKTGMTYILDSKVTSERQIGFYSPVYQNDELVGIAVGFYGEDFIDNLLEVSVFGQDCDVLLCDKDGTIIYSTDDDIGASNFLEDLSAFSFSHEEDEKNVREAFLQRDNTLYSYLVNGDRTVGIVSYIGGYSDFFLVLNFPAQTYKSMISNASMNGAVLLIWLIVLFVSVGVFYIVRFFLQKKRLLEETKNSNDIHFAMSRLFENFVIVNAGARTYHYIEGMPDVGHIPNDGAYNVFADDLLDRFPNEDERADAAKLIDFDRLTEQMNSGRDIISCNLHAPIREEEWFTYNFIVVSRDKAGKVSEFIIARQDITALQKKEEETRRILEHARDEAEKGNRAKSNFLSSMSHDIRTPMNAIIGYTNIALDKLNDKDMVEDSLKKIAASSHYLLSLINDVLDMSKIESGKIQLNENMCDIGRIFERIADLTRSQASKKSLSLSFNTDKVAHPCIIADELRLEQILINIIGNAVKYTPNGGSVYIAAEEIEELSDNKSRYCFSVRDTGIGMSEDFLPHIFESFSRETNSTINKIQGTGLGMAITSRLVKLMGGEISVESKLGEGSVFFVNLEFAYRENTPKSDVASSDEEAFDKDELAGKKILLVEDNDINAEIATLVLSEYGIEVERASNGQEGVDMLVKKGSGFYDAVLMDIQMPIMNGYEATRRIRSLDSEYAKRLPIIAMSANAYEEDVRESLASGMNGHIAKPFEPQMLAYELYKKINAK